MSPVELSWTTKNGDGKGEKYLKNIGKYIFVEEQKNGVEKEENIQRKKIFGQERSRETKKEEVW